MERQNKGRSGSQSNDGGNNRRGDAKRTNLPGAPSKSNRQTGGSQRKERDDSSKGPDKNTTKKGANAV
ncbi:MAG TPA: hypothetical protein VFR58_11085 [Flavisolibacter sp.]|nr:hypothetical protein [Flavisolibacter sp.]